MIGEGGGIAAPPAGPRTAGGPIRETRSRSAGVYGTFSILSALLIVAAAGSALVANAGRERAPQDRGVCWRAPGAAPGRTDLRPIEHDVASLETCAAALEAWRLIDGRPALGAFQGYFLFVDARAITSATSRRGFRYPVFQPAQRRAVDDGLRDLIADRGGRLPAAEDMEVERR